MPQRCKTPSPHSRHHRHATLRHEWCTPANDAAPHSYGVPPQSSQELAWPSLKFVQRHITLQTKSTSRLLKVMCLEHPDDALIHQLQRRCGVRRQNDELDVTMQVLQHVGVGGSVFENHQATEGEALRHAILLQLMHQVSPAARLENVSRHPTSGIGVLIDRQDGLFIARECTRVFSVVHQEGLEFAVSCQVSPQYEGETVLERFEARGRLLLPCDVHAFKHLPLQTCFIDVEDLLGLVTPPPPPQ